MRATTARLCWVALAALAGGACVQAASLHKPALPTPLFELPPGSTNGTKADAFPDGKARAFPAGPQVSIPLLPEWNNDRNFGPILPWSDKRIGKQVPGCAPEQVHLSWWGTQDNSPSVLVSWATCDLGVNSYAWQGAAATTPLTPQDTSAAVSRVWVGTVPGVYTKAYDGVATSYTVDSTSLLNGTPSPGGSYASPIIHHTVVSKLIPGVKYYYKIENAPQLPGGAVEGKPFYGSFKTPGGFPMRVAVGADSGEVSNVTVNIDYLVAKAKPDVMLLTGDLTYANKFAFDPAACYSPAQCAALDGKTNTFSPRWDSFARLFQPLAASVPMLTAVGNHELEQTPVDARIPAVGNGFNNNLFFTRFANFLARYPVPQTRQQALHGPAVADLAATTPADADQGRGLYFVSELPGVATVITLSSYTYTDTFTASDPMFVWFKQVLSRVNRVKTPWLVVRAHAGVYNTGQQALQLECFRQLYEPLFRLYNVDIYLNGHDHDYERSGPVYNYQVDEECGAVYISAGSFGPNEGIDTVWLDQWPTNPAVATEFACPPLQPSQFQPWASASTPYVVTAAGQWGVGGRCLAPKIAASGNWCPPSQPPYSKFRNEAYGVGMIDFLSPTEAVWTFYSQQSDMLKPLDAVKISRSDMKKCALTPETQAAAATTGIPVESALVSSKLVNVTAEIDALKAKLNLTAYNATMGKGLAVNPVGAASGFVRGAVDYVEAKAVVANFSAIKLVTAWNNKTGGRR